MSIQPQVMPVRVSWQPLQARAPSNAAEGQKKCSTGVADECKRKDPTTTFRTGEMNTLQAQKRLPFSAPACLHS